MDEPWWREDVRSVVWWVLVGAAAGAIAGAVVGGIGGRLVMLLLRVTSSDLLIGTESDDGFEIGVVSAKTLVLIATTAALGSLNGILYAALRGAVPVALRLPLWTLVAAAAVGEQTVHADGVDFTLLEPRALAVVLFVLLPAGAAIVVVQLVERWLEVGPWSDQRLTATLALAALLGTVALAFAAVVAYVAVVLRRTEAGDLVQSVGRVVVPAGLLLVAVISGWQLLDESARILG